MAEFRQEITQNVEDMLTNRESRAIINNCQMVQMLNQSDADRKEIGTIFCTYRKPSWISSRTPSLTRTDLVRRILLPFANKFPTESPVLRSAVHETTDADLMSVRMTKKCYPQNRCRLIFYSGTHRKNAFRENGLVQHTDVEEGKRMKVLEDGPSP